MYAKQSSFQIPYSYHWILFSCRDYYFKIIFNKKKQGKQCTDALGNTSCTVRVPQSAAPLKRAPYRLCRLWH